MSILADGNIKLAITNATSSTMIGKDAGGMFMETSGSTDALSDMRFQARASGAGAYSIIKIKPSNQTLEFHTSGVNRFRINADGSAFFNAGNVAKIQLHNSANFLYGDLNNTVQLVAGNAGDVNIIAQSNGVTLATNATAFTSLSDISLKENLKPLENVLDKIKDYRCVEYNLKNAPEDKKIGFIAQDWENDFNPIISKDKEGILGIKYSETIPVLLKAIQELKAEIELLKAK